MLYQCPLCSEKLNLEQRFYRCANNHQFDIAKEGYVNLIPANKKRSKNPGDNSEMMQARRRFLNNGHYAKLQQKITQICKEKLIDTNYQILDIGCGEGYYTNELESQITKSGHSTNVYGLDISKVAIRYAAKKYPLCHFSVASSQNLPFVDQSLNLILRIYAPCNIEEMNRCIADNGVVVTVTPAARHLYQLRALIYDEVRLHEEAPENIDGFNLEHEEKLSYQLNLDNSDSFDLLQMTPFAWKATDSMKQRLQNETIFTCEADFMIRIYRKN
ncbi:23S rRNA (guanine(745)-N(1))-methyltransferase [Vibrio algarum]|uniref:23S rRNA (Guanine(745)-N(1))-methyltransferase n=1 Tax=Vibrio algarum TaxID=3020714 RepID=A0ABT4YPF2_9VIBR|nr:23S rRNA (guanine(745)-N(1))-methyltransferase [Vibrio sp. KJ40-1]MDB1123378.1 23S rRNA (guanine(745)-N(1))-methyltransferase [Vibrio sp. KJ40-1]